MPESMVDQIVKQRVGKCRHFNGCQHQKCEADVSYDDLRKQGDLPCFGDNSPFKSKRPDRPALSLAVCEKRSPLTLEEARKEAEESEASFQRTGRAIQAIQEHAKGKRGVSGSIVCPACGGTLRYSIAGSNGHIHGACSTDKCVRFMM